MADMTPAEQAVIDAAVELVELRQATYPPNKIRFPSHTEWRRLCDAEDALTAAVERYKEGHRG